MSITSEAPLARLGWFLRQARGWTERSQAEVAERVAMLLSDYVGLEEGRRLPRREQIVLLAEVLGVDHHGFLLEMAYAAGLPQAQSAAAAATMVTRMVPAEKKPA
jgi:transcriptional regulator with XRE-family HTH domain